MMAKRSKCAYSATPFIDPMDNKGVSVVSNKASFSQFGMETPGPNYLKARDSKLLIEQDSESGLSTVGSDSSETEPDLEFGTPISSGMALAKHDKKHITRTCHSTSNRESTHGEYPNKLLPSHNFSRASSKISRLKRKQNIRHVLKKPFTLPSQRECDPSTTRHCIGRQSLRYSSYHDAGHDPKHETRIHHNDSTFYDFLASNFDPFHFFQHPFGRSLGYLFEVDLKVQPGYRKEPVPIISFTSMHNAVVVIGHPIEVEALEDGSSEAYVGSMCNNLDPVVCWRTSRRRKFRVPRTHFSFHTSDTDDCLFTEEEGRGLMKKSLSSELSDSGNTTFLQDIRTPSLLPLRHKSAETPLGEFIQHMPEPVYCVPMSLVFNRLLQRLNGPWLP